jgi:2-polyprenyl-6-methoxyphenol hydroxylase-like FAD-dependent oxidoreductase
MGYLLARAGVSVTVLEKHGDFLRDFRGDTVHPSTMAVLDQLGLLDAFLPLVDFRTEQPVIRVDGRVVKGPTVKHLDTVCPFVGFTPQWDFLNLLAREGKRFPTFDLRMEVEATGLVRTGGRVVGVTCRKDGTDFEIHADLVVAADGRSSTLRDAAGLRVVEYGIPIDVLWFRLDRPANDDGQTLGWVQNGRAVVTIPRRDHYQAAMIIQKGAFPHIQAAGLPAFRETIARVAPLLADVSRGLKDWEQVKLLAVQLNRLSTWHEPGLLFIGDAAHAMSPVGGVGINLAIQDAVAAANILAEPLRLGHASEEELARVQLRREPAARKTQWLQQIVHANLFSRGSSPDQPVSPPWYVRWLVVLVAPLIRRLAGRWIGMGFQPESVETTNAFA